MLYFAHTCTLNLVQDSQRVLHIHVHSTLCKIHKGWLHRWPENRIKQCDILSYVHQSKATDKLTSIQNRLELDNHKLIQDVKIRGNSVFYVCKNERRAQDSYTTTMLADKSSPLQHEGSGWRMLSTLLMYVASKVRGWRVRTGLLHW